MLLRIPFVLTAPISPIFFTRLTVTLPAFLTVAVAFYFGFDNVRFLVNQDSNNPQQIFPKKISRSNRITTILSHFFIIFVI
jgi:hypothetical protein